MSDTATRWFTNPTARSWRTQPSGSDVLAFHHTLPGYAQTPLRELPGLGAELGVGRLFVKEEASRLGLPAFKILGASYAISRLLSARYGKPDRALPLDALRELAAVDSDLGLMAATDGNHGRAVAHVARLLGVKATIFVPTATSQESRDAILGEGADRVELDLPYDDVVAAAISAADAGGASTLLVQDTAWEGYTDIPQWIVDGYTTLFLEVDAQLGEHGVAADLVAVPVGVGSLAQSAISHYRSGRERPTILSVEAENAPAIVDSLAAGHMLTVPCTDTIMAGLNCGTPSSRAWPYLVAGLDAAITVTDDQAARAVHDLDEANTDAGPCGAATLAALRIIAADEQRRESIGLTADGVVVLFATEGREANPLR